MKVALCISGESRNTMFTYPYFYDSFFTDDRVEVDVYYHTWERGERVLNLWKPKVLIEDELEPSYQKILNTVEFPIDWPNERNTPPKRIRNNLFMFYGIHTIINAAIEDGYEYIVRSRPDVFLYQRLDLYQILTEIEKEFYDCWIPTRIYNYSEMGYNDQFAVGNSRAMKSYAKTYKKISEYLLEQSYWYPEEFLRKTMDEDMIDVYQHDIHYQLARHVHVHTNHIHLPPSFETNNELRK